MVRHADELPRMRSHQFLLVQACAAALYAIQVIVDLVRAVEGDVEEGVGGKGVEGDGGEARADDDLAGLVAGGHETDGLRGDVEGADGVYDVDDCRAGADANVGEGGGEVVCDCADGGGAFGGFDVGH